MLVIHGHLCAIRPVAKQGDKLRPILTQPWTVELAVFQLEHLV